MQPTQNLYRDFIKAQAYQQGYETGEKKGFKLGINSVLGNKLGAVVALIVQLFPVIIASAISFSIGYNLALQEWKNVAIFGALGSCFIFGLVKLMNKRTKIKAIHDLINSEIALEEKDRKFWQLTKNYLEVHQVEPKKLFYGPIFKIHNCYQKIYAINKKSNKIDNAIALKNVWQSLMGSQANYTEEHSKLLESIA